MSAISDNLNAPAPLDYGQSATTEGFLVRRSAGGVVISAVPTARRVLRAMTGFLAATLLAAAFTAAILYAYRNDPLPVGTFFLPAVFLLVGVYELVVKLVWVLNPVRWEVDAAGLTCVARRLTGVAREQYPRAIIADVRVERVRLVNQSVKRPRVVFVTAEGARVAIASGSKAELHALALLLRDALGLPPDPGGESTYPPGPRGARVRRVVTQTGVGVALRPPVVPWGVLAVAGPIALLGALGLERFVFFSSPTGQWSQTEAAAWAVVRVAMITLIPLALLCAGAYRLGRTTGLAVQRASLFLVETGLVRPCNVEWPLSAVASLEVAEASRPRPGRAALAIHLTNGETVRTLDGARRRDVEWAAASLRHAIARAAGARSTPS